MRVKHFFGTRFTFLWLVALALSLRAIFFCQTIKFVQPGSGSDAFFYLQWAKSILRGNVLGKEVFYALPVYPYFLSLAYLFSAGEVFGLILIQMLIGSLNCGLIYILGKKLFNNQVGIISSIIACGYLMFVFYDRMLLPASLAILLGLLLMLLLLSIKDRPSLRGWFGAGLFLGLCSLACASFSLLAIFILFWIIFEYKREAKRRVFLYCLSFSLSFLLVLGAVTLRNYLVAGDAVVISAHSGINFYIGNNPQASGIFKPPPYMLPTQSGLIEDAHIIAEKISAKKLTPSQASSFWFRRSLSFMKSQPLNYLKLLAKKLILFWNGREYVDDVEYYMFKQESGLFRLALFRFSLISPLALLGIFLSKTQARRINLLYLFVLGLMLATVSFFINSRYRLIVVPFLIIFAGNGLWQIFQKYKTRQYKDFILASILLFLLYLLTNIKLTDTETAPNFTFHYNRGAYLSEQREYEKAEEEYRFALRLKPDDFMSYLGLGNIYYRKKDFAKAIDNYKRALAINPFFRDAHFNLGFIYNEMGKTEEAEDEFKQVLKLKADDCAARYNLGKIYQEKGLIDAALKEYERALEIEPGHEEILQAIKEIKASQPR